METKTPTVKALTDANAMIRTSEDAANVFEVRLTKPVTKPTKSSDGKFAFTKKRLESIKPRDKRFYVYDDKTEGLALCITPAGSRTFYMYKWLNGKPERIPLGTFGSISVENARKACRKLLGAHANGEDIQAARRAARHEQTIDGAFKFWLENAKSRGTKTWDEDEKRYERYLRPWKKRKLSSIRKPDVQSLFARVAAENGKYAANRLLALIKAMFHRAPDMGFTGTDPTAGVKKLPEEKRDRFLHADELQGFFKALFAEANATLRDLLFVALMTGARKSNVMEMKWSDIDFASNLWRIPDTKSGKPVVVPLVGVVVSVLQARREAAKGEIWVFPSNRGATGHITEVKSAWKRIVESAKLADCRPHDLRRSLASHMAIGGTSLPTIGAMLGHTQPSTTAIYARLSSDPIRTAAESAATAMLTAGGASIQAGLMVLDVKPVVQSE